MINRRVFIGIVACLLLVGLEGIFASPRADDSQRAWVSRVISLQGRVLAKRGGDPDWKPVKLDDTLYAGDQIRVEANSRAGIVLNNSSVLRLDQNTTLIFTQIEQPSTFIFRLLKGAASFFSHRPHSLKFLTPFVNGVVEGTEFYVQVDEKQTRIDLFEGRIRAENDQGVLQLAKGQRAVATSGQAPRSEILVHPRDSVQWALYYPPILAIGSQQATNSLNASLALYNQGRTAEALESMEAVAQGDRDARYYVYRAALLLNVGRVDRARDDIRRALDIDHASSEALALKAIIAVVHNRKDEALAWAQQAVQLNPRSAASLIALSYAHQATFDLTAAQKDAQAATDNEPESSIAWARLAELRLSSGRLNQGIQAAQKAAALNSYSAHADTILGFAYLMRIETRKSQEAFNQAIRLDSTAPLPRLGLGLAKIREGDLDQGREQIEIAVALDPSNALVRSYLGKAYFDEKRGPLDEREFEIAKSLDPGDPTPWFYDAIRKQTLNRPVEALQDLQKSIELNDNRAVYRSRLLLDEDLAARSAALGRIYSDLSFQEQALREGAKSLRANPANYSAHRLLADIYASRPRHEIAQVSELLQSQLFQPLNLVPVKPQMAESALSVPEGLGAQRSSSNEFNPLFTRNQTTVQLEAMAGNNNTRSDDAAIAGLHKGVSYSLGQYYYDTDGFRQNNNLHKSIYSAFIQAALSHRFSMQLEYTQKQVTHGDLELRFDPTDFSHSKQISRDERIPRLGIHYAADVHHHFIASLISNQTDYRLFDQNQIGPLLGTENRNEDEDAHNAEVQYLYLTENANLILGAGYYDQEGSETVSFQVTSGPFILYQIDQSQDLRVWHANAYSYAHLRLIPKLDMTLGVSADAFEKGDMEARQINPKFGLSWSASPTLTIRGAAVRTFKRSLVTNQTIEPTQVSGFTQLFDDSIATDAKRYGLGLDYKPAENLFCGAELTFNYLNYPLPDIQTGMPNDYAREELHHRLYMYWLAHPRVAVSAEYLFDDYESDPPMPVVVNQPYKLRTDSFPITFSYFHPTGLFAKLRGTYINQHVKEYVSDSSPPETFSDVFTLVDLKLGYRLPKRYGIVAVSVTNLFDTSFNYQDTNYLTASEQDPSIKPERQFFVCFSTRF